MAPASTRKVPRRRCVARGALLCVLLAWVDLPAASGQQPDAGPLAPAEILAAAQRAEREVELERAEALYERVVQVASTSREARRARVRLEYLRARRHPQEGYAPLAVLERARRGSLDARSAEALAARVEQMPPGPVRDEALFLLGEAWFRRLGDPERAMPFYRRLAESETAAEHLRRMAVVGLAEAGAAAGELAPAQQALLDRLLEGTFEARAMRAARFRETLHTVAIGVVAVALLVLLAVGRPWRVGLAGARRSITPGRLLALLYVVGVPAAIAELYEPGTAVTFLAFGAAVVPLLALAAVSAESLASRGAGHVPRALALAATVVLPLPVAYLVLEQAGGLASFGL